MSHEITISDNRDEAGKHTHYTMLDTGTEIGVAMRISSTRFEFYPLKSTGLTMKSAKTMAELKAIIASALP